MHARRKNTEYQADSTTETDTTDSTLTTTQTDTQSLHETGSETYGAGGLVASGAATSTFTDTSGGTSTSSGTGHTTQTATTTLISTLAGITASETLRSVGSESSTDTGSGSGGSTATLTTTQTLGGGGVLTAGTDSHTFSAGSNTTETLASTATVTTTDTAVQSSTLGGVTATSSLTTTATDTAVDRLTTTDDASQSGNGSVTSSGGNVTGGGGAESGDETSDDTHTSTITGHVTSSSGSSASSNLAGADTSSSVTGAATDDSTATTTGTGSGHTVSSSSSTAGTMGLASLGSSAGSTSYSSLDSHSLSDVATATSTESTTVTATTGGVTSTQTLADSVTSTQTTTLSGDAAAATSTMTATATLGPGGIETGGASTSSQTQTDVASTSTSMTATETGSETETASSTLGGITTSLSESATLSGHPGSEQSGDVTVSSVTTEVYALGFTGVVTGGSRSQSGDTTSTLTSTLEASNASTATLTQAVSSVLSAVTSSETLTATHTITTTGSATSTLTATATESSTETLGSGGLIASGFSTDSLDQVGNDTGSQTVSDRGVAISNSDSASSNANAASSSSSISTLTSTLVLTTTSNGDTTLAQDSDVTLGATGVLTAGRSSQTLYETGSVVNHTTLTATETATAVNGASSTAAGAQTSRTVTSTDAISTENSISDSATSTLSQDNTMTLGALGVISGGSQSSTLTTSGTDSHSFHESDSNTSTLSGHDQSVLDLATSTATMDDQATGLAITTDGGTGTSSGSSTSTMTFGAAGLVAGGTATADSHVTATATHSVSDVSTSTLSHSMSDAVAGDSSGTSQQGTTTGTLTHTTTISSPETHTTTQSGTVTYGSGALVSGGTSTDTLYQTAGGTQSDFATGTLTATAIGGGHASEAGDSHTATNTSTATLIDSSHASSGRSTTLSVSAGKTLGGNAVISAGTATQSIQTTASETYSLYETSSETHSDSSNAVQAGGAGALNLNSGVSGSEAGTRTSTLTDNVTSGHTATTTLGTSAAITGGSWSDTLYETGNDSDNGFTIGTNIRHATFGNEITTFTSSYTLADSASDSHTHRLASTGEYGGAGRVGSGTLVDILTSGGTLSHTFDENSDRTVYWNTTNSHGGAYDVAASSSNTHAESKSLSLVLGTDYTIASGVASDSTTTSDTFSHSAFESGTENQADSAGGPAFSAPLAHDTEVTSQSTRLDRRLLNLGVTGSITGGTDSVHFTQNDSSDSTLAASANTHDVHEIDQSTYTLDDALTETLGTGGIVSSGSESFTWDQGSSNTLTMILHGGGEEQAEYRFYDMTLTDFSGESFSNAGSRVLGQDDEILESTDTYIQAQTRTSNFTIDDSGTTDTPYHIHAEGFNDFSQANTGSSTLTTDGHLLNSDTYHYIETSGNVASTSESRIESGVTWTRTGESTDSYSNDDTGVILRSDREVVSYDTFTLDNFRALTGELHEHSAPGGDLSDWHDLAYTTESLHAGGTKGATPSFSFETHLTDGYAFEIEQTQAGTFSDVEYGDQVHVETSSGWSASGPGGDSYSTTLSSSLSSSFHAAGYAVTDYLGNTENFAASHSQGTIIRSHTSGLPPDSESDEYTFDSDNVGFIPGVVDLVVVMTREKQGRSIRAPGETARYRGGALTGASGAVHRGTSPGGFGGTGGLLTGLLSQGVHAMVNGMDDMGGAPTPEITVAGDGNPNLIDGNDGGEDPEPAAWNSHPEGVGYRSADPPPPEGGGSQPNVDLAEHSARAGGGTPQGSTDAELGRLNHAFVGSNETPSVTRDAPPTPQEQKGDQANAMNVARNLPPAMQPGDEPNIDYPFKGTYVDGFVGGLWRDLNGLVGAADRFLSGGRGDGRSQNGNSGGDWLAVIGYGRHPGDRGRPEQDQQSPASGQGGSPVGPRSGIDNALDLLDGGSAGVADKVTSGLTTRVREAMYGDIATRNHTGTAFQVGQVGGTVLAILLSRVNPCAAGGLANGLRALNAMDGIGNAMDARDSYRKGDYVSAALSTLSALSSIGDFMSACFAAGTPLLTVEGDKPIEQIRAGDWVLALPEDDPQAVPVPRQVEDVFQTFAPLMNLVISGTVIRTTAEHPFWVRGRGWIGAHQLSPGDELLSDDGRWIPLERVDGDQGAAPVYNLCVEGYHTYFVGMRSWGFSVWAHNAKPGYRVANGVRQDAVARAWKEEANLVDRTGMGTRAWTDPQKRELLSTGKVRRYEGHHINSVSSSPLFAGLSENIEFLTRHQHFKKHGSNWQTPTSGDFVDRG